MNELPSWRSLLYVPADQVKLIEGAHKRGADAIILDLEDAVAPNSKESARANLKLAVKQVSRNGAGVIIRINKVWSLAWRDIEAAVEAGPQALLLPKVEDDCQLKVISTFLDEIETKGLRKVALIALVESGQGLNNVGQIAFASQRLQALIPGNEDLALDLGIKPEPQKIAQVQLPMLLAARAANLKLFGTLGGNANFQDLEAYKTQVKLSKDWGFNGGTCIHPNQIPVIHAVYEPDTDGLEEAKCVVELFEAAAGGPVSLEGKMIDRPIYLRAKILLDQRKK